MLSCREVGELSVLHPDAKASRHSENLVVIRSSAHGSCHHRSFVWVPLQGRLCLEMASADRVSTKESCFEADCKCVVGSHAYQKRLNENRRHRVNLQKGGSDQHRRGLPCKPTLSEGWYWSDLEGCCRSHHVQILWNRLSFFVLGWRDSSSCRVVKLFKLLIYYKATMTLDLNT